MYGNYIKDYLIKKRKKKKRVSLLFQMPLAFLNRCTFCF